MVARNHCHASFFTKNQLRGHWLQLGKNNDDKKYSDWNWNWIYIQFQIQKSSKLSATPIHRRTKQVNAAFAYIFRKEPCARRAYALLKLTLNGASGGELQPQLLQKWRTTTHHETKKSQNRFRTGRQKIRRQRKAPKHVAAQMYHNKSKTLVIGNCTPTDYCMVPNAGGFS